MHLQKVKVVEMFLFYNFPNKHKNQTQCVVPKHYEVV